ncbi:MAG: CRTAC1 family protein [Sandaracinaceae bacterium]|nr:hypothetical protein [Myxococcales bacterium]
MPHHPHSHLLAALGLATLALTVSACDPGSVEGDASAPSDGAPARDARVDDGGATTPSDAGPGGDAATPDAATRDAGPRDAGPPRPLPEAGDPSFDHVTNAALDGVCETGNPFGFTLADWNYDGYPDLQSWSHGRESHCMWTSDGDGTFTVDPDWTAETAPFFTGGWNVQAGDLDGDGDVDALGRTTEGHDGWIENTTPTMGGDPSAVFHRGPWGHRSTFTVADFDGDGDLEIGDAGPTIYRLDGSVQTTLGSERSAIVFDWNGDSYPDVVMPGGPSWTNDGDGSFSPASAGPAFTDCQPGGSLLFDADLDGDIDVLCYTGDDDLWIVVNEGGGAFRRHDLSTRFNVVNTVATKASHSVADYNNDGYVDVLIMGRSSSSTNLLLNRGGLVFERADNDVTFDTDLGGDHYSARPTTAPHDYDLDGRVDFVGYELRDDVPAANLMLWRNTTPAAGGFVQVVLTAEAMGNGGNRDAIGAIVEALVPGTETRVGSDYRTLRSYQQGMPTLAHVGTDTQAVVDLRVTWPSGHGVEVFPGVRADGRYIIRYASSGSRIEPWAPGSGY